MRNPISTQVFNHLEFLGYKLEDITGENDFDFIRALSDSKSNIVLRIFKNNTIWASARYELSNSNSIVTQKFLNALNSSNAKTFFSKAYYVEDESKKILLVVETFTIDYHKQAFVILIDSLERDVRVYLKDLEEYYSEKNK